MVSETYTKLKNIYKGINEVGFNMAVTFLMDNGYKEVEKWTDEAIAEAEVPELFAEGFYRNILKTTRKIAESCTPIELIQFCMTDTCLDTKYFSNKLCYRDLEQMIEHRISYEDYGFNRN